MVNPQSFIPQSFIDPQRGSALRQQLAQRNQQAHQQSGGFGFDDFLTKILLPVGLGIATGVTGGVAAAAAPAVAAAGGAAAAGTAAGGLGSAIGAAASTLSRSSRRRGLSARW